MFGNVEAYQADQEDWEQYVERMEQYFLANGIAEDNHVKRRAAFISTVGQGNYKLLASLVAPVLQ